MVARTLDVAEKTLQTEAAIKTLPADNLHRLGNHAYDHMRYVGFTRKNIVTVLIDGFEIVVVGDAEHVIQLNFRRD